MTIYDTIAALNPDEPMSADAVWTLQYLASQDDAQHEILSLRSALAAQAAQIAALTAQLTAAIEWAEHNTEWSQPDSVHAPGWYFQGKFLTSGVSWSEITDHAALDAAFGPLTDEQAKSLTDHFAATERADTAERLSESDYSHSDDAHADHR